MLTPHQKQLISELEIEFNKMNAKNGSRNSLVKEILDEIEVEEQAIKEISKYNRAKFSNILLILEKDIQEFKELYAKDDIFFDVGKTFILEKENYYSSCSLKSRATSDFILGMSPDHSSRIFVTLNISKGSKSYDVEYEISCTHHTFGKKRLSKIKGIELRWVEYYLSVIEQTSESSRFREFLREVILNS